MLQGNYKTASGPIPKPMPSEGARPSATTGPVDMGQNGAAVKGSNRADAPGYTIDEQRQRGLERYSIPSDNVGPPTQMGPPATMIPSPEILRQLQGSSVAPMPRRVPSSQIPFKYSRW